MLDSATNWKKKIRINNLGVFEISCQSLPQNSTVDKFLGGKIEAIQPENNHHRSGIDAILLAASVPRDATGTLYDLGAGVGVAGLAVASRIPNLKIVLVEKDETLRKLAAESLKLKTNKEVAKQVSILNADVTAKGELRHKAGLISQTANHVIINPPFYNEEKVSISPSKQRAEAHILDQFGLESWIKTATDVLVFGGELTLIFRADGLSEILSSMSDRFGSITILPIFSRKNMNANRILVRGTRGSRGPLVIKRGLIIHKSSGNDYTPLVETILRNGECLDFNNI